MRVFVAVTPSDDVLAAALEAAAQLRRRVPAALHARWLPATHMHLTVRFVGYLPDDRVPALLDGLKPPLPMEPFELELGGCGVFPPHGQPRVIWIGLAAGLEQLRLVHQELNRRVEPLGYASEERPFAAHLTLARVKDARHGEARAVRDAAALVRPRAVRCRVNGVTVFESRLTPAGPSYRALLDVPFHA